MKYLLIFLLSLSVYAKDPEIVNFFVDTNSIDKIAKKITFDTVRIDSTHTVLDTVTTIKWIGSVVFSCLDSNNDSMGVFIDLTLGTDTVQIDSIWGVTTAYSGNNLKTFFSFRSVQKNWTGKTPMKVRLSLDDQLLGYNRKPKIIMQPMSVSIRQGQPARFSVLAVANPAPSFAWMFNGSVIDGANSSDFVIPSADTAKAGKYWVKVSNNLGTVASDTALLTVTMGPVIITQPHSVALTAGQDVIFSVVCAGNPPPSFQWKKNGVDIAGATMQSLSIPSAQPSDTGMYSVVLTNAIGTVTSTGAALALSFLPIIAVQPQSQTARIGQSIQYKVRAAGNPVPAYQWKKNGILIQNAVDTAFGIPSVWVVDTGAYTVTVTNSIGSVISDTARFTLDTSARSGADSLLTIPGGTFQMGQTRIAEPVHTVTLSTFKMSNTLVTQREYARVMGVNPSIIKGDLSLPVENVTWFDAVLYCNLRSKMEAKDTVYSYTSSIGPSGNGDTLLQDLVIDQAKNGYRLPNEAEYEFVCRGGTTTEFYWGKNYPPASVDDTAAIDSNAVWSHSSYGHTFPVGSKKPNPWGLYDIVGQVQQWQNDWDGSYSSTPQSDPTGPISGTKRIVRGGSWSAYNDASDLRTSARKGGYVPKDRSAIIGFRVVIR
jgi:formylglycine-generating enzyme required for sulfatase activity